MNPVRETAVSVLCWLLALPLMNVPQAITAADVCGGSTQPIACENALPGASQDEWDLPGPFPGSGDASIQGYATAISVNHGETVRFKIDTDAHDYRLDIYRLGYYGGAGARLVATVRPPSSLSLPQTQPACANDDATGLIDCGNWAESASWAVPARAVSGIYLAKAVRTDTGGASHIVFIVRDDEGQSDLLFQTSDMTWQAYNPYGGNSLYVGNPVGRAYKVSYNRPFATRGFREGGEQSWLFNAEYPMLRWLEASGYNVSYTSGVDSDRRGALLLQHKIFLSVGHDEYWSAGQRANVTAARDRAGAPVHLAFFSGNTMFWKTRWEPDAAGTPYRTVVCYKETHAGAKIDPTAEWTGTWRDARPFNPEGPHPENALTGTLFTVNGIRNDAIMAGPEFAGHRFWRNTRVATLRPGDPPVVFPTGTLGYEWDEDLDNGFRPEGLQRLSSTVIDVTPLYLLDEGSTYGAGLATHNLTLYRASSGALVFGSGTNQWSWGLDAVHDRLGEPPSRDMQQATVNLFEDMGVQPSTLASAVQLDPGIVDRTTPSATISAPSPGVSIQSGDAITISGTAIDGGGVVSAVEVSVDGSTWRPATGTSNWEFEWRPLVQGSFVVRARAIDDAGNRQPDPATVTVNVIRVCPCSVWAESTVPPVTATADDNSAQLGMRFQVDVPGTIRGVRFFKGAGNDGVHVGNVFTADGLRLASATFTDETSTGWQQADFGAPVPVVPGVTYVVSYFAPHGRYSMDRPLNGGPGLGLAIHNAPITALGNTDTTHNGVFVYTADAQAFPDQYAAGEFRFSNYFVDVSFVPDGTMDATPPSILSRTPTPQAVGVSPFTAINVRFSEAIDPASVSSSTMELRDDIGNPVASVITYAAASRTATLRPSARLADARQYTAIVRGGPDGIRDLGGNALATTAMWSFTTAQPALCPCTIWTADTLPTFLINNAEDQRAVAEGIELGVKFRADEDGSISAVRFYKSLANAGTHVVTLWDTAGHALALATVTGETPSGWQEARFPAVAVRANQTYIASYHTNVGRYSVNRTYFLPQFSGSYTRAPLRALVDGEDGLNGVFRYGPHQFPTESFFQSNYWVDVVFDRTTPNVPPTISDTPSVSTFESVALAPIAVTVGDVETAAANLVLTAASSNLSLVPNASIVVAGTGANRTVTITPAPGLTGTATITLTVTDADGAQASDTFTLDVRPRTPTTTLLSSSTTSFGYGQTVTLTSSVSSGSGVPTGSVEFFDSGTSLGTVPLNTTGGATLVTTAIGAGTRSLTAVYRPTGAFAPSTSAALAATVARATATSTLAVSSLTPQYSDIETFTATVTPSVSAAPPAESVTFKVGTQAVATVPLTKVGANYQAVWTGQLVEPSPFGSAPTGQMKPGGHVVTAAFVNASANYTLTAPTAKSINVAKEDARVSYAGSATMSLGGSATGTVTLTATIKDITAVTGDAAWDANGGDIRNAQVQFIDRSTNTVLGTVNVTLSGTDAKVGTASFAMPVNLGTATSKPFTIGFNVTNYYNRNNAADNAVVTVTK